tara:strand:- start:20 stop:460 length:441 start_codon:yes stop_codon:yes gene_type:complete
MKESKLDIFVDVHPSLDKRGLKLTCVDYDLTHDGWIRAHIRWNCKVTDTKYAVLGDRSSSYNQQSANITFPNVKYRFRGTNRDGTKYSFTCKSTIEVGLFTKDNSKLGYSPKFLENLKWGVNVYFAPKNWNTKPDKQSLFKWSDNE